MLSRFSSSSTPGFLRMLRANETKRLNSSSVLTTVDSAISSKKTTKVTRVKTRFRTGTTKCRCCCFLDNWRVCQHIQSSCKIGKVKVVPGGAAALDVPGWTTEPFHAISDLSKFPSASRHGRLWTAFFGGADGHRRTLLYRSPWRHGRRPITLRHWTDCAEGDLSLVNLPVRKAILLTSVSCSRTNTHPHQCHEMLSQVSLENDIHSHYIIFLTLYSADLNLKLISLIFFLMIYSIILSC